MRRFTMRVSAALIVSVCFSGSALAQDDAAARLAVVERQLIEARERIAALERRLDGMLSAASAPAAIEPVAPDPVAEPETPAAVVASRGSGALGANAFNPDISVVGNVFAAAGSGNSERPSFELHEAEVAFQAVVDPYARGDFFVAFEEGEVDLEEGYVTFLSLPAGLQVKAGKMKALFGRANTEHLHVRPWADTPLVLTNLLGEEGIADAGVSLSHLFGLPGDIAAEGTLQVFRGEVEGVFAAPRRQDVLWVGHLDGYRDITEAANLEIGVSAAHGSNDAGPGFHTDLAGVDAIFRWKPLERALYQSFTARAEAVWSRREQEEGEAKSRGAFVSLEWQPLRRWRVGARGDWSERADDPAARDRGVTALVAFAPSEFALLRLQGTRTRWADGEATNELLLQLQFAIGAHGAHPF